MGSRFTLCRRQRNFLHQIFFVLNIVLPRNLDNAMERCAMREEVYVPGSRDVFVESMAHCNICTSLENAPSFFFSGKRFNGNEYAEANAVQGRKTNYCSILFLRQMVKIWGPTEPEHREWETLGSAPVRFHLPGS